MSEKIRGNARPARVIMHLDMDAFFVNVELLDKPHLRGEKIIVARNSTRSVVLSASYEARADGVGSAMPLAHAKNLSPQAIIVEPSRIYRDYSARIMAILHDITDSVEQVSVDEAFVDLTSTINRLGDPVTTAQNVRQRIATELNLPASAGIASTKFVAKMASTGSKPNGLWVVPPARVQEFLDPLPVSKLWGVGAKTQQALAGIGVYTVANLRAQSRNYLQTKFGTAAGAHLYNISRGIDPRPVIAYRDEKSMGAEHTFAIDCTDAHELKQEILALSLKVAARLRAAHRQTRSLSLKIRHQDFHTVSRSVPLPQPTAAGHIIFEAIVTELYRRDILIEDSPTLGMKVRLVGVRAEKIDNRDHGIQGALFDSPDAPEREPVDWAAAEHTMDAIHQKFGVAGLSPASLLKKNT
ncbi:DNA polymerase IV [Rothia sp. ZJ932]|uniref:DNA polymerase IV n=1 Tax=Rothia sp. ZJ932 TaxID=2810516 RepID=UPI0019673113|nr:DNA polymerase IV [Rothia sp. ZJ932]QRZ60945.1 DNA polymerase IV [Rothia sp. ZJ932]